MRYSVRFYAGAGCFREIQLSGRHGRPCAGHLPWMALLISAGWAALKWSRATALAMTRIFRMPAVRATFPGRCDWFRRGDCRSPADRARMANGGPGGVEQRAAHERSSMAGFGLPALLQPCVWGRARRGRRRRAPAGGRVRRVGDQRRGHDGADAAHPAQSLGEAIAPHRWRCGAFDRLLDGLKALGQRRDDSRQAFSARSDSLADRRGSLPRRASTSGCRAGRPAPSGVRRRETVAGRSARLTASAR